MEKLKSIYFLRGVAALAVVVQHSFPRDDVSTQPWWLRLITTVTNEGYLGVPLFFVISGFCIHLRVAKGLRKTGRVELDWRDFWWRRMHRLYPPYFFMLLLSMSLWVYAYTRGGANIYPDRGWHWLALDFGSHLLMLHGFHPALDQGAGNPAYWTLAREEYLYLLYAAALIPLHRRFGILKTFWVVLAVGLVSYLVTDALVPDSSPWHRLVTLSPLFYWAQWALGALAVEAHYGTIKLPRWCYSLALFPAWFALGWACRNYVYALQPVAYGMAFFTLLNYCVRRESEEGWPGGLAFRWLFSAGIFSYSMYLAHPVVVAVIYRLVGERLPAQPVLYLLFCLSLVLCCVAVGKVYYELVEKHFLNTSPKERAPAVEPLAAGNKALA